MKFCIIIPARYKSSRFPGKPLCQIKGKKLIILVLENINKVIDKRHIYVATDDKKIYEEVEKKGFKAVMTSELALTGTDRVAEVVEKLDYDIYINVQGDEPLINPNDVIKCAKLKNQYPNRIINGYTFIKNNENPSNINIPKIITNEKNRLIYISRALIPSSKEKKDKGTKYKKQVCIYGFSKSDLKQFRGYGRKSLLESSEDIEILRFLEMDKYIHMFKCSEGSLAVDVPSDVFEVEKELERRNNNE